MMLSESVGTPCVTITIVKRTKIDQTKTQEHEDCNTEKTSNE
jgi:hypothetical protein